MIQAADNLHLEVKFCEAEWTFNLLAGSYDAAN